MTPRKPYTYTTELEEQLGRDDSGALRASLYARLTTLQTSLRSQLRRLHPLDHYRQLEAASRATDAALEILRIVHVPRPDGSLAGPLPHLAPRRD
ncbi:EscE/YscE/SsaE family type III secretion system needle protein co-chaperone [Rhizobacter sp. OV335]|uniref:EscE/YscE/SsaE family type III secretion system needle protein co-chaperone n=1 Tax=Rhizobacter sp. OV335 TaxID=1500264 RepID=UPI0009168C5B|nr:EscE/YscE/SsaE family type III secretion system needle protein co-chaperone [Rhizobacter sp. OV335]SHM25852.1 type III secretion system protein, YseE family [Rhizobacter sp. OV335]